MQIGTLVNRIAPCINIVIDGVNKAQHNIRVRHRWL